MTTWCGLDSPAHIQFCSETCSPVHCQQFNKPSTLVEPEKPNFLRRLATAFWRIHFVVRRRFDPDYWPGEPWSDS